MNFLIRCVTVTMMLVFLGHPYLMSAPSSQIKVWHRGQGNHFKVKINPQGVITIPIENSIITMYDLQYDLQNKYKGMRLSRALSKVPKNLGEDSVLLHFSNGMLVPLPLDVISKGKFDPVIATAWLNKGKWTTEFPKIFRKDIRYSDPRPLGFLGNKIVVDKKSYPSMSKLGLNKFNPFKYCASLVGLELVKFSAWVNQFRVGSGKVEQGLEIFSKRCIYCHGVKNVGAKFGWDFVDPLPIYKKRPAKSLLFHVKYQRIDAVSRGLLMPPQFDFSEAESSALWEWLKASAERSQRPYAK